MQREQVPTTVVSTDPHLVDCAQAAAAATGASLKVVSDLDDLRTLWRVSPVVVIGSDLIQEVASLLFPRRERVYLLGRADSHETLCRWSMPLGASVILLPEGGKWLSRIIAGRLGIADAGTVVAVKGGAGGVGASTLCLGLAQVAKARSMKVAVVDCDHLSGGIDLLMGAENSPGWRWDKLSHAVGQIADITPMLPQADGVTLVSMDRANPQPIPPPALEAVLECLARSHDLVLVDLGRGYAESGVVRRSIIVSTQTVRSLAATKVVVSTMGTSECALVIRKDGSVSPQDAARTMELPLIGVLPTVADLPRLADRGIPPSVGGRWTRECTQILSWCLGDPVPARRL